MTNILLVFSGGTIGSTISQGTINTSEKQGYRLIELYSQNYSDTEQPDFKIIQALQLLSENLSPGVWGKWIQAIDAEDLSQFDGVIVTHGTDTLAYTAAALGFYFNAIQIPMLLVSSNYPLELQQANGLINFHCAIEFIKQRKQPGVFVPYQNPGSATHVHIATRLTSCLQLSGDFISVQSRPYLQFNQQGFTELYSLKKVQQGQQSLLANFSQAIFMIKPYPGLDYSSFNLDGVKVILHDLYHSGTACTTQDWGDNYSLRCFIELCSQRNIKVYLAPSIKTSEVYHSIKEMLVENVFVLWNMSIEAAYVKLMLAYGNYSEQKRIEEFLLEDLAYEHV